MPHAVPRFLLLGKKPLAACVAAVFGLAAPAAMSVPLTFDPGIVTSCDDSSSASITVGTLRYAALHVASGGTIDLSSLPGSDPGCTNSTISLQLGAVFLTQADVTIKGPGRSQLTINAAQQDRVLYHLSGGTLTVQDVSIAGGYSSQAHGGCIYSPANVVLEHVDVSACQVVHDGAQGGAVYAGGSLDIEYSSLVSSTVDGVSGTSYGGGAYARNGFIARYSTISGNHADGAYGSGGGAFVTGTITILGSTISGNTSTRLDGGIGAYAADGSVLTITNSTISGNHSDFINGGIYMNAASSSSASAEINNSTIAFNTATSGKANYYQAAGLGVGAYRGSLAVTLRSSVISNNTYGAGIESDLTAAYLNADPNKHVTFSANSIANIVLATDAAAAALLPVAPSQACPLLGPLRDNGGLTQTHALLSNSPAIDAGDGTAGGNYDQRGSAIANGLLDYLRNSPVLPDIGAYEVQYDEIVFNAGFDGC